MRNDALREILKRLTRLENAVGSKTASKRSEDNSEKAGREGLPEQILRLKEHGFFKEPKTAKEVQGKLQPVYHCAIDRVAMALLRLKRRRKLRKTTKTIAKRKQVAYVW